MRRASLLALGAMLMASPTFAQQSAWELYRAAHPGRAANLEDGLGSDTWREERNQPLGGALSMSTVSWGYETGEVDMWVALMNSGSTPLCVQPDIIVTGSHSISVYKRDEEMALLPPYSSRLIFTAGGRREEIGSFQQRVEADFGPPPPSGRCSDLP